MNTIQFNKWSASFVKVQYKKFTGGIIATLVGVLSVFALIAEASGDKVGMIDSIRKLFSNKDIARQLLLIGHILHTLILPVFLHSLYRLYTRTNLVALSNLNSKSQVERIPLLSSQDKTIEDVKALVLFLAIAISFWFFQYGIWAYNELFYGRGDNNDILMYLAGVIGDLNLFGLLGVYVVMTFITGTGVRAVSKNKFFRVFSIAILFAMTLQTVDFIFNINSEGISHRLTKWGIYDSCYAIFSYFSTIRELLPVITLMLLVSRLDSKYLSIPQNVIVLFVVYASIQSYTVVVEGGLGNEKVTKDAISAIMVLIALVAKTMLVVSIAWLVDTGRMHFYIDRIRAMLDGSTKTFQNYILSNTLSSENNTPTVSGLTIHPCFENEDKPKFSVDHQDLTIQFYVNNFDNHSWVVTGIRVGSIHAETANNEFVEIESDREILMFDNQMFVRDPEIFIGPNSISKLKVQIPWRAVSGSKWTNAADLGGNTKKILFDRISLKLGNGTIRSQSKLKPRLISEYFIQGINKSYKVSIAR